MRVKAGVMALALVLGGVVGVQAQSVPGVTNDTIKIGLISEFSTAGHIGRGVRDSAKLIFDKVNAEGGIHGRKLEVVTGDSACQPSPMVTELKRMIDRERVFALFGSGCSGSAVAAVPIVDKERLPWLATATSHVSLVQPFKPSIFRMGPTRVDVAARAMVEYGMQEAKPERIAILNMTMEYGAATASFVRDHLKAKYNKTASQEVFNLGDVDFSSQIARLKEKNPQVTFLCAFPKEAAILLRQAQEHGLKTLWVACEGLATRDFPALVKEAGAGLRIVYGNDHLIESDNPGMVQFRKHFDEKYPTHPPNVPDLYELGAYASAQVFVDALKRAGKNLTRESLVKALEATDRFTPVAWAPVTFTAKTHEGNTLARIVAIEANGTRRMTDFRYEVKD